MTAPSVIAAAPCAPVRLRIADEWLVASAPFSGGAARCWPLLLINSGLSGSARLVRGRCGSAEIRADLLVGEDHVAAPPGAAPPGLAAARLDAMFEDVAAAVLAARCLDEPEPHQPGDPPPGEVTLLKALCEEAGWPATVAASGDLRIPLDAAGIDAVSLTLDTHKHLRAVVVLGSTAVPELSREAVGRLLLSTGGHVRSTKGCLVARAGGLLPAIGIAGERGPVTAASLDRALGALAVARQAVGREVQALYDPHLARVFLSLGDPTPGRCLAPDSDPHPLEEAPCLHTP